MLRFEKGSAIFLVEAGAHAIGCCVGGETDRRLMPNLANSILRPGRRAYRVLYLGRGKGVWVPFSLCVMYRRLLAIYLLCTVYVQAHLRFRLRLDGGEQAARERGEGTNPCLAEVGSSLATFSFPCGQGSCEAIASEMARRGETPTRRTKVRECVFLRGGAL